MHCAVAQLPISDADHLLNWSLFCYAESLEILDFSA
jgi:hypothetical protein